MQRPYDLVIVGLGSGGLVAARFARALGLRVAAVERARPGGDCLWTGCVPSKALLASARAAHAVRTAERFGVGASGPEVDLAAVWSRIHRIQEEIAATDDSPAELGRLGIELLHGHARLAGPHGVEVDGRRVEGRFVLLCTGSRPAVPPVSGLERAGPLSSETIFAPREPPRSLVCIGGGPQNVELAQGCRRLGIEVTLLEREPLLLGAEEPELAERLARILRTEGVDVQLGAKAERVTLEDGRKVVYATVGGEPRRFAAEELLVGVGRLPNVEGLELEAAGVRLLEDRSGIAVDARMRTSVPSIYASGDLTGRLRFTHAAAHESVQAVRDMFLPGRGRVSGVVPWCTFTDPELAHVGLTRAQAERRYGREQVEVARSDLTGSDRARADGATEGALLLVTARGRLVGAHVLAPAAGELIHELALAVRERRRLRDLAGLVHVYPTYSTSIVQLGARSAFRDAAHLSRLSRAILRPFRVAAARGLSESPPHL